MSGGNGAAGKLTTSEVATLLELVREGHELLDVREFRAGVLEIVRRAVPCSLAAYNELAPELERGLVLFDPPESMIFEDVGALLARVGMSNPIVSHNARTRDGRAYKLSDFLTQEELHETPLWQEALGPLGVEYQIAFALPSQASVMIGVTLNDGERDFAERERTILNLARPHLALAFRNAQVHSEARARLAALDRGLEAAGKAALQIGTDCRIRASSSQARQMLTTVYGRGGGDHRLPADVERWVGEQRARPLTAGTVPMVVSARGARLLIRFVRHRRAGEADVLLLERTTDPLSIDSLRALGLTPREAEALRCAAQARSVAEIGADMGISPATVRKHLENIYRKLGVSSRSAAVTAAWAGAEIRTVVDPA